MTETQKELERLRTLQEGLDVVAKAVEVQLPALADKIDNIKLPEIDTTELAKEATLNEVSKKIDNLNSGGGGDIGEKLQQIIDSNILRPNLQGITFVDGEVTNDVAALIVAGAPSIVSIGSETMNEAIRNSIFSNCSSLREVNFPLATSISGSAFQSCSSLREANLPLVTSIGNSAFYGCSSLREVSFPLVTSAGSSAFYGCSSLREANLTLITSISNNAFSSCTNLIKLTLGVNLANSINLSAAVWNPTSAYSTTSRSLIPEEVQAEHPLWYNLDYLLYNIRECIAANLPDRTGQSALTITFHATMKGHINNSEETVEAFTSKNWTIA